MEELIVNTFSPSLNFMNIKYIDMLNSEHKENKINNFDFKTFDGGKYWDLGTWKIINNYWNNE